MTVNSEENLRDLLHSDFLNCSKCGNRCKDPQLLSSLEIICACCVDSTMTVALPSLLHKSLSHLASASAPQKPPCDYCCFAGSSEQRAEVRCVECGDHLCPTCSDAHQRTRVTRDHRLVKLHEISEEVRRGQRCCCSQHQGERADKFCSDCRSTLCVRCTTDDEHSGHRVWKMEELAEREKATLNALQKRVGDREPNITGLRSYIEQYTTNLTESHRRIREEIQSRCQQLRQHLNDSEAKLLSSIDSALEAEISPLREKIGNLTTSHSDFQHAVTFTRRLITHGRAEELLSLKPTVDARLEQLLSLTMDGVADELRIDFRPGSSGEETVTNLIGRMTIERKSGSHKNIPGEAVSILPSLTMIKPQENGMRTVRSSEPQCLFSPPPSNIEQNTSTRAFPTPMLLDRPKLMFEFVANSPGDSRDIWPTGLAINSLTGDIYVLDRDNKKVKVFDMGKGGKPFLKLEIGRTDAGEGFLINPYDLCITSMGQLLITDYHEEAVKMFDSNSGKFVASFSEPGLFKHPRGVTADPSGEFFAVADCRKRRVTIHSIKNNGKVTGCIQADESLGSDIFSDPYYVCITPSYRLVVTDWTAPNLKIFDINGHLVSQTGSYGTASQEVLQPYGVCCDIQENLLVADNTNHRIQVVSSEGQFLRDLISKRDSLWHPMAVDINNNGHLVVSEALGKVKVFKYM